MGSETATGTGGLWRPVAGFPRTDSESAFQEFLKKIPSNQNLASLASGGLEAGGALGSGLQAASLGIPRVSSFDLLRNLGSTKAEAKPAAQGIGKYSLHCWEGVAQWLEGPVVAALELNLLRALKTQRCWRWAAVAMGKGALGCMRHGTRRAN
eukprot:356232-Chlamydomonas_euryale.AAC.32